MNNKINMLSKKTNLLIIQAVKASGYQNCTTKGFWRKLHAKLSHLEELKNIGCQRLQTYYCTKLIFDIKDNKFNLPPEEVKQLCYPLLKNVLNFSILLKSSNEFPTISDKRLKEHKIILRYLLSKRMFNNEIWEEMHKLSVTSTEKYCIININNPQYNLTDKEKNLLRDYIDASMANNKRKVKQTCVNPKSTWLESKKPPQRPVNKDDDCAAKNPENERNVLEDQIEAVELSDDSDFEFTIPWSFYDSTDSDGGSASE